MSVPSCPVAAPGGRGGRAELHRVARALWAFALLRGPAFEAVRASVGSVPSSSVVCTLRDSRLLMRPSPEGSEPATLF